MTRFDVYGTTSCSIEELSAVLADRLAVTFTERESDYLGNYLVTALADGTSLKIQPNTIPGDDGADDLYEVEHPDVPVLVLVTSPTEDGPLSEKVLAAAGLTLLRSELNGRTRLARGSWRASL
ncbi:hypothetical protein ACFQ60_00895 [Streptomyces zhihengii]|uniref:Uncharacterized protein n=1 Tax=Streptomyces zhihengii TaxID=1818004 RepID=A0ABS2V4D2_9ACTN|nr:hypothetical protein [Streptomyces zhihengii]MBM9624339.1 hypothetical protein [Streptomyces zhihengii]